MERKIGEIFKFELQQIEVVEQTYLGNDLCFNCCFCNNNMCSSFYNQIGDCDSANRIDRKNVIFKIVSPKFLQSNRIYTFDFKGKKVKSKHSDGGDFEIQTKFDLAWFIDRINPDLNMQVCENVYKYEELKQILCKLLKEKNYSNVKIYQNN